jgi:hypothetical protein
MPMGHNVSFLQLDSAQFLGHVRAIVNDSNAEVRHAKKEGQ